MRGDPDCKLLTGKQTGFTVGTGSWECPIRIVGRGIRKVLQIMGEFELQTSILGIKTAEAGYGGWVKVELKGYVSNIHLGSPEPPLSRTEVRSES